MNRRQIFSVLAAIVVSLNERSAHAEAQTLDQLLDQYSNDPTMLEEAWLYRDRTVSRGVGRGTPSKRAISQRATEIIIRLEVGSKERYESRYQAPIWPKGESGVTIGIGYDLRYATLSLLKRDWGALIDNTILHEFEPALGMRGANAAAMTPRFSNIRIPWNAAITQFNAYLPYAIADTEEIFPNSSKLSDDSLGALVSLVYNRGKALPSKKPSRREMVAIHDLMVLSNFAPIPNQIRSMKRLWTTKDSRGLVIRRKIEAELFESGMT